MSLCTNRCLRRASFGVLCAGLLWAAADPAAARPEEKKMVQEGKPAPEITLPAANIQSALPGKKDAKTLSVPKDVAGKNVVLFFFPKAMTRG